MSEGATVALPAAIANAVADALSADGVESRAVDPYRLNAARLFARLRSRSPA